MRILFYFLIIPLVSTSCRSVSINQLSEVRRFAAKTEEFTAYPETIMIEIAQIREARGIWYAGSFIDPELHLTELNAIVQERINNEKIPGRVKIVFKILDDYAKGLSGLASDLPFKAQKALYGRLGADLDELAELYNLTNGNNKIPFSTGSFLTKSMNMATNTFLANRQMKFLKGFVIKTDTLFSHLCDEVIIFLSAQGISQLIDAEETGIQESFRFYYSRRANPTIWSDRDYVVLMKRVNDLKNLRNLTIRAAGHLKSAHETLKIELDRKKTLNERGNYLFKFYQDMEELENSIHRMKR